MSKALLLTRPVLDEAKAGDLFKATWQVCQQTGISTGISSFEVQHSATCTKLILKLIWKFGGGEERRKENQGEAVCQQIQFQVWTPIPAHSNAKNKQSLSCKTND